MSFPSPRDLPNPMIEYSALVDRYFTTEPSYLGNSVPFSSVTQSCPTLCSPMDCSTPDFPVIHCLLSPGVCSNSCSLSWRCHPTISSSATPFSSCLQSYPASGSFPMSWLFTSSGQSIGVSASASVLLMNIRG